METKFCSTNPGHPTTTKLKNFCPSSKATLKDLEGLDKILVIAGPGAFTGLRVGITIANTLAFTQKVPIISISTFEYLQHKIPEKQAGTTAIMNASRQRRGHMAPTR